MKLALQTRAFYYSSIERKINNTSIAAGKNYKWLIENKGAKKNGRIRLRYQSGKFAKYVAIIELEAISSLSIDDIKASSGIALIFFEYLLLRFS